MNLVSYVFFDFPSDPATSIQDFLRENDINLMTIPVIGVPVGMIFDFFPKEMENSLHNQLIITVGIVYRDEGHFFCCKDLGIGFEDPERLAKRLILKDL